MALIGFARAKDYIDEKNNFVGMACLTSEQSAALDFISDENGTRIRMADKKASLELLGKHLKLFGADDHGASTAVKVIIVNSPRPLRPAGAIAVQVEQGNGHSGNGHKNEPPEIE